jgi:hypothetical protein
MRKELKNSTEKQVIKGLEIKYPAQFQIFNCNSNGRNSKFGSFSILIYKTIIK